MASALRTSAVQATSLQRGDRYWVPHADLAFVAAAFKEIAGDKIVLEHEGKAVKWPKAQAAQLKRVIESQLHGVDDATELEEAELPGVLHTLLVRYKKAKPVIYTRVARILVAVNPFQMIASLYGPSVMQKFLNCADSKDLEPHIYGSACDAVKGLTAIERNSQVVLVSGESGAGKTESTKLVLSYVLEALQSSGGVLQEQIMRTNPVLESFGNARTVRNHNSSRFGKFLQMSLQNKSMKPVLCKCHVEDYLLELTRVCCQGADERGYHVFFQLLKCKDYFKGEIAVHPPSSYNYIKNSQHTSPTIDDKEFFADLTEAFDSLGFSSEEQMQIFKITMGVLAMGNVEFKDDKDDSAQVNNNGALEEVSACFGIDGQALQAMLVERQLKVGKEITKTPRSAEKAGQARDALARQVYGRLFKYIVHKMNDTLGSDAPAGEQFFGILDIAGFEMFEVNSLEQLFINLSNEHLQAHFNNYVFKMEMKECEEEGITLPTDLAFKDNSSIIALLDSKHSVLGLLDEEISVPKGSDTSFLDKVCKTFKDHGDFKKPRFGGTGAFEIQHYAGPVEYKVEGFLQKNVDRPPDEATETFKNSSSSVLATLGSRMEQEIKDISAAQSGKKKPKTVGNMFRTSLQALLAKMASADPHFVRCIKPNEDKAPNKFTPPMVAEQLINCGVVTAVKIRQSGFSLRVHFEEFIPRYAPILTKKMQVDIVKRKKAGQPLVEIARDMVKELPPFLSQIGTYADGDMVVGTKRVFCRQAAQFLLIRARDLALVQYAVDIQKTFRGYLARKMVRQAKIAFQPANDWMQEHEHLYRNGDFESTASHMYKSVSAIQGAAATGTERLQQTQKYSVCFRKGKAMEKIVERMTEEAEVVGKFVSLEHSTDALEIDRWVSRGAALNLGSMPVVMNLVMRAEDLKTQLPLIEGMQKALADKDPDFMEEIHLKLQEEGLVGGRKRWLPELDGASLCEQLVAECALQNPPGMSPADVVASTRSFAPRKSIAPVSDEKVRSVIRELAEAMETYNHKALESALQVVVMKGITDAIVEDAKIMYKDMSDQQWLLERINEEAKPARKNAKSFNRLTQLCNQVEAINATPDAKQLSSTIRMEAATSRARQTLGGAVFSKMEDIDEGEMQFIDESYADLTKFPRLKNQEDLAKDPNATLSHVKQPLKIAMTKVEPQEEPKAVLLFTNVLGFMGDKSQPELTRTTLHEDLLNTARGSKELSDELYVQVMKQIKGNKSARSTQRGWNLMLSMCEQAPPSPDLFEFVHVYCMKGLQTCQDAMKLTIQQSIAALNTAKKGKRNVESDKMADNISLQILCLDQSFRWIRINGSATAEQAVQLTCEQLRIPNASDWALNVLTEPHNVQRLLPKTASISFIVNTITSIKNETKKKSYLLLKRLVLRQGEMLDPRNVMHANLTYCQARHNYLQCIVPSPNGDAAFDIAAKLLKLDQDDPIYKEVVEGTDPVSKEVLDTLMPRTEQNRLPANFDYRSEIMRRCGPLDDQREGRMMLMNHIFQLFQQAPLFGCYWWDGSVSGNAQLELIDEKTMRVANMAVGKRNGITSDGSEKLSVISPISSVVFAVSYKDIAILNPQTGADLYRFSFAGMADERVLAWEPLPKGKYIQLLVTTRRGGFVELKKLNFKRFGVNDIAYSIETLYKHAGWKAEEVVPTNTTQSGSRSSVARR